MARETDTSGPQPAPPLDSSLARLAARQHGVVTAAQLAELGLGPRGVRYRAATGRLHRLHRGVYAVGHPRLSLPGRRLAAVLASGAGAVLSHRSAAAAWGLRATDQWPIEVTIPRGGGRLDPCGVRRHQARRLIADEVARRDGIPITTVARTLVDLAGVLHQSALARAVNEAEVLRLLDVEALRRALERANGRRGTAHLRALLEEPSSGPTRSALEDRFLALLRRAGLPLPHTNALVDLEDRRLEVDALYPRERLIVELDGAAFHRTRRAFHLDRARDLALAAEGYVVVRLTWQRVTRDPNRLVEELRRVLAARGGAG